MRINCTQLHPDAKVPSKAHLIDAGYDLTAVSILSSDLVPYIEYGTGLSIEIPIGYVGLLFPRSSISNKKLSLANSVGVIDPGYRGEVKVRMYSDHQSTKYEIGDRVAQLIVMRTEEIEFNTVKDLSSFNMSARANGGFGSTG